MKSKFLAVCTTAALALGLAVVGVVAPASAHTGDLNATGVCNTATGEYDVTYKLTISQTGLAGITNWRTGTTTFESTPSSNAGLSGAIASNGAGVITLGTIHLPGTSKQAPWAYAFTTWSDKYTKGSDGGDIALAGTCVKPDLTDAVAAIVTTPATCEAAGTASWSGTANVTTSVLVQTPGAQSGTATATVGHKFSGGEASKDFPYVIEAQLNPNAPPCYTPIPQCTTTGNGGTSTDVDNAGWTFAETREKGHNDYVSGGLHVYTTEATSLGKAAGYHGLNISLRDVGVPSITLENASGVLPSIQLGVDRDGDGNWDGYLVNEGDIYGHGNWWTNKTGFGVAPGGGYPSLGTLDAYLQANPNARIVSFGYSLGSGVVGDAVIKQITVGCLTYTFDRSAIPVKEATTVWTDGTPDCAATEVARTGVRTHYSYTFVNNVWVESTSTENVSDTRPLSPEEVILYQNTDAEGDCYVAPPTKGDSTVTTIGSADCKAGTRTDSSVTTTYTFPFNTSTGKYGEAVAHVGTPVLTTVAVSVLECPVEVAKAVVVSAMLATTGTDYSGLAAIAIILLFAAGIVWVIVRIRRNNSNIS